MTAAVLFDLTGLAWADLLEAGEPAWTAVGRLTTWLRERVGGRGAPPTPNGVWLTGDVVLGRDVVLEPGVMIKGPALIGDGAEIRQGAYLRGDVVLGEGCVVGHCSELKHCVLLPGAKAPHFNYVGDSLVGRDVNLGAGTVLSNVKLAGGPVRVRVGGRIHDTGLTKFGAVLGDGCQTGCHTVLNPGTVAGRGVHFFPQVCAAGWFPPHSRVTGPVVRAQTEERTR